MSHSKQNREQAVWMLEEEDKVMKVAGGWRIKTGDVRLDGGKDLKSFPLSAKTIAICGSMAIRSIKETCLQPSGSVSIQVCHVSVWLTHLCWQYKKIFPLGQRREYNIKEGIWHILDVSWQISLLLCMFSELTLTWKLPEVFVMPFQSCWRKYNRPSWMESAEWMLQQCSAPPWVQATLCWLLGLLWCSQKLSDDHQLVSAQGIPKGLRNASSNEH